MDSVVKSLSEMRRNEWIAYEWRDVTEMQDADRMFLRGLLRNPADALTAAQEFDTWVKAAQSVCKQERGG